MGDRYMLGLDIDKFYPQRNTVLAHSIGHYFNEVLRMTRDSCVKGTFQFSVVAEDVLTTVKVKIHIFDVQCESGKFFEFKDYLKAIIERAESELVLRQFNHSDRIEVCINIAVPVECSQVEIAVKFKEVDNMFSIPEVKEIIHNTSKKKGEVFTVVWADNTETSVKLMEGDTSDEYVAFMYCMSIKMFGSKGDCKKYIKEKKQVFSDRVERRSQELKNNRERKKLSEITKKEVPYAGGLIVPQLSTSSMFKRNGGNK